MEDPDPEDGAQDALSDDSLAPAREDLAALRAQLQEAAPGLGPMILRTLARAMQSTKRARINDPCGKCGCSHARYVEIPDAVAASTAAKTFLEAVEGRPAVAGEVSQSPVIVRRVGQARS